MNLSIGFLTFQSSLIVNNAWCETRKALKTQTLENKDIVSRPGNN